MTDDNKKKSKARLLADSINEAHPARANFEHAQQLERAAMSEFKMNEQHPDPKVRKQMTERFLVRAALENEIATIRGAIEDAQGRLDNAEAILFLKRRELTAAKRLTLQTVETISDEISQIEAYLEELVPEGIWYDLSLISDTGAAADQDAAYDWHKALRADEDEEQEAFRLAARLGELYDLRVEKAAEYRALEADTPQGLDENIALEREANEARRDLAELQEQLNDALLRRDQKRYDDDEWQKALEALSQDVVAENEDQLRLQREAIAAETTPPSPSENDRLIAQMEARFAEERKERASEKLENKTQLDRIENLLGTVMQQLNATQEENEQLKAQIAAQDDQPATPSVKEASATVEVSFSASAKAEVGKASVSSTSQHRYFDKAANRDYWKDPRKRNTEWRIPFAERHWKARQSVMIRSGVDLFQTPILKVRLMTYFRQNVWNCEILNVETGATALLALGHGKFSTPVDDAPFVMTCLDTDDDWRQIEIEVMDELGYDKHQRLQKHECIEIRNEVLHRMNRAA